MPVAVSYQRFSSSAQRSGESLTRQSQAAQKWISEHPEHNLQLSHTLTDEARSAYKGRHISDGELGRFIEAVRDGVIPRGTWLIVEALDRLSRESVMRATNQLSSLVISGITVVTTIDNKIYNEKAEIADMIISIAAISQAYESSRKSSLRISETKRIRFETAQTTKQVLTANTPAWITTENVTNSNRLTRKYAMIPEKAAIVQDIFEMSLTRGFYYIARHLIESGVPNIATEKPWNAKYISELLKSKTPLGHLESKHGIIENTYPQIIDENLWLRVQSAIASRVGSSGNRKSEHVNLFTGLGKCLSCGGIMRINYNSKVKKRYFECINRTRFHRCENKCRYRVDIVEKYLFENLDFLSTMPTNTAKIDTTNLTSQLSDLRSRESFLANRLKRATDDVEYDFVIKQVRELQSEIVNVSSQLNAINQQLAVQSTPILITDLTDKLKIHAVLKQRLSTVSFCDNNDVLIVGHGVAIIVNATAAKESCKMILSGGDGTQSALVENGKLRFVPALDGMPRLDNATANDILRKLEKSVGGFPNTD